MIVIYKYPDGSGEEVFGPFRNEKHRNDWVNFRQKNWPQEKRWKGTFALVEMRPPLEEGEEDGRIVMYERLGLDCEHPNKEWRAYNVEHYHCPDCNKNWTPKEGGPR